MKTALESDKEKRPVSLYKSLINRRIALMATLTLALTVIATLSVTIGSLEISFAEILKAIFSDSAAGISTYTVWNIRLPRTIGAVIAGAGLGISGAAMQNILKNPLASPFTIGVSHGAAFGAAFAIIVLGAGQSYLAGNEAVSINSPFIVMLSAFTGSMISVLCILGLSMLRNITAESVILAGVALSAFFGASTMFLQYFANDIQIAATLFWTFGDLGKAGWQENAIMFVSVLGPFIYFMASSWQNNALQWGDEVAASLGVRIKTIRIITMVASSLTVAVITSFLGIIGFVGLITPHIIKIIIGNDYRFIFPCSALFGALLLVMADIVSRTAMAPVIIPVGIITSFTGAPLFLYLLIRGRRH